MYPNRPNTHPLRYPYAPRSCWHYVAELIAAAIVVLICAGLAWLIWYGLQKGL